MNTEPDAKELFERYSDMVYRIAVSYGNSVHSAEDIVQEVFLRYLKKQPLFESGDHEKAWFIRVAVNCCKSLFSSAWNRRTCPLEEADQFTLPFKSDEYELYEVLSGLPPKKDATKDQEALYAQYGQVLDSEIELDNGTLRLDAALYDETNLIIPFRYLFHSDVEGYETLTAGADLNQASPQAQAVYRLDTKTFLGQVSFRIAPDSVQANSQYIITDSILSEDGTISGSLLVNAHEPKFFEPGTVIQLVKTAVADILGQTEESVGTDDLIQAVESADSEKGSVVYAEFTLGTALEQRELTIDAQNTAALKDMGISVDRISLSPLSLCYSGKGTHTRALSASVTIVLKDGRIIKRSPNGSGYALSDTNRDNTSFSFFASVLFEEPVLLEDVAEIQIRNHWGSDIHIPVGNNSTE